MHRAQLAVTACLLAAPTFAQEPAPAPSAQQQARDLLDAGDLAGAEAAWAALREANPADGEATFYLGYALHMAGKLQEAHDMHLEATAFADYSALANYNHACVHALWNQPDPAFQALDVAVARGFNDAGLLGTDSDLTSLRSDPRWAPLVERVGDMPAQAETPTPPATPALEDLPNERRMDFFLGSWTVTPQGSEDSSLSRAEVAPVFGGAGLRASMYTIETGTPQLRTEATYFPTKEGWRMLWMDHEGQRAELEGRLRGGRMVFNLVSINGEPAVGSRALFGKLGPKGFAYRWQNKGEDGKWTDAQTWRYE